MERNTARAQLAVHRELNACNYSNTSVGFHNGLRAVPLSLGESMVCIPLNYFILVVWTE